MKQQLAIATLFIVLVIAGCISKTAMENEVAGEKQGAPMIITAEEANLYEQNKVIGKLPVGTKVYMVQKGNPWCIVDVPIEQYEMMVRGAISADVLTPAKSAPNVIKQVETPAVSPTYDSIREKLWSEFFPEMGINAIACTENTIWLGTDSGLIKFSADSPEQYVKYDTSDGLLDDDVLSIGIYKDEVWVGTYIGLSRFKNGDFTNYRMSDGLLKGAVMAIDVNDKYVWLGLDTGLSKLDKAAEKFENFRRWGGWSPESGSGSAPTSSKGAIYADSIKIEGDMLWHAAFNLSLMREDGRDIQTYSCGNGLIHSRVVDFTIDGDTIWCSTLWGLTKLDKHSDKYKQYNLMWGSRGRENPMVASAKDGDSLWIALRNGICRFDTKKEKFITYYAAWDMFGGRYISTLAADANYLWVGTAEGLWRMDKSVAEIVSDEGLVDDFESRGRILARGWQMKERISRSGRYRSVVDDTVGANGTTTSLRNDYVAPDYREHYLSHFSVDISSMDVTEYDGISFFIKAEPAVRFKADISEINETWSIGSWNVPKDWMQVKVPFDQFRVHAQGSGNRILELHALNNLSFGVQRSSSLGSKPAPGEKGKVWIDEIRFYKNDGTSKIARL